MGIVREVGLTSQRGWHRRVCGATAQELPSQIKENKEVKRKTYLSSNLSASSDGYDLGRDRLVVRIDTSVTDNIVRGHIHDRLKSYQNQQGKGKMLRERIRRHSQAHECLEGDLGKHHSRIIPMRSQAKM